MKSTLLIGFTVGLYLGWIDGAYMRMHTGKIHYKFIMFSHNHPSYLRLEITELKTCSGIERYY